MASQTVRAALGNARAVASGVGGARGLVKPKGFDKEWNTYKTTPVAPVSPAPLPRDAISRGQESNAQKTRAATDEQVNANRLLGEQQFGISGEIGANGYAYNDYKNNPYSQAAVLQHNHESNERGINTTAGQALYSGQTENAQSIDRGNTAQAHAGVEAAQKSAEAAWRAEIQQAEAAEREAISAAETGAVERAQEAPNPEAPVGGGSKQKPARPAQAPPNKKWAWNGSQWHLVKA